LLNLEKTLERAYSVKNDSPNAKTYYERASKREEAIQKYLWVEEEKFFADYNFLNEKPSRIVNMSIVYPMAFKIATQKQAVCVKDHLEKKFLSHGGLLSTLIYSGEQWDAPNGWAPLQWMAYKGMKQYNMDGFAEKIANRWTQKVESVFEMTGKLTEKYNVVDEGSNASGGEYPNQDGFGWTNGVYLKLKSFIKK